MLDPFFTLAARSPTRQRTFRRVLAVHLVVLACTTGLVFRPSAPATGALLLGQVLLVAGIVEGALLVGWRLTQLPKSQALEFVLVSPLRPAGFLAVEALVGLTLLGFVTLSGLPVLVLLVATGCLDPLDPVPFLLMPWTWGAVTGLGLTAWAYEPLGVRRSGERGLLGLVVLYLLVGVLAGENLKRWLDVLPPVWSRNLLRGVAVLHIHNPFGVVRNWVEIRVESSWERTAGLELMALVSILLLLARAAWRLQNHFEELHYTPEVVSSGARRGRPGEHPLTWWAVKRVTRYSGRINLWLAGGFGVVYALYVVAGPLWPAWMGRRVFETCDEAGGVAGIAAALVVLAAVPAAFQYGLWDSNTQDRCRRLELLLLTGLEAGDYWRAAVAAAWKRGRGYLGVALLLWATGLVAGSLSVTQVLAAAAGAALLWSLYFTVGFRAFTRGVQANGLGMFLTLGLPLLAFGLFHAGWSRWGAILPPGLVYGAATCAAEPSRLAGPLLCGTLTLWVARRALWYGDQDLRRWYDRNQGSKVVG